MHSRLSRIASALKAWCVRAENFRGWRRNLCLFITGALAVFMFAPFGLWFLACAIMPIFFVVLSAAPSAKRAALDGFWFGYGYFMASTYWIAISLTVDAASYAWLIPFCVFGLSAVFALYIVLFASLYHRFKTTSVLHNALLFAALWVCVEYVRSVGMFGFPWNLMGYLTVAMPFALSSAAIVGVFGQSLWVMALVLLLFNAWISPSKQHRRALAVCAMGVVCLIVAGSVWQSLSVMPKNERHYHVRVVQPNIPQSLKWQPDQVNRILRTLEAFTQVQSKAPTPDIIVWPETAVPFTLRADSDWVPYIAKWVPKQSVLIFGSIMQKGKHYGNGLSVLNHYAGIEASYLKRQLVPFGEFIPFRSILPIDTIANVPADFSRGTEHAAIYTAGKPSFLPMICYESAFPWLAVSESTRPDYLLTITNDAWFGKSPGPYQHFAMSRMRAAEQGLPVVRAANTGISAIIDATGNVKRSLSLGTQGIIDARLPQPLASTPYAFYGESFTFVCLLMIFLQIRRYVKSTVG